MTFWFYYTCLGLRNYPNISSNVKYTVEFIIASSKQTTNHIKLIKLIVCKPLSSTGPDVKSWKHFVKTRNAFGVFSGSRVEKISNTFLREKFLELIPLPYIEK